MLKTRIVTALVLLCIFLSALFYLPPEGWLVFVSLIAVVAAWETPDGKLAVRPVWLSPDVDALPAKVVELQRELRPVAVVADHDPTP